MAGKGDKRRRGDSQKFNDNWDEIDWGSKTDTPIKGGPHKDIDKRELLEKGLEEAKNREFVESPLEDNDDGIIIDLAECEHCDDTGLIAKFTGAGTFEMPCDQCDRGKL